MKYSKNYGKTSGSLWNYYRNHNSDDIYDDNCTYKNIIRSKSFIYKTSITGSFYNINERNANGNANPDYDANKVGYKRS